MNTLKNTDTFDDYENFTKKSDQLKDKDSDLVWLGFCGEIGSLLTVAKKYQRDEAVPKQMSQAMNEELGDVFWYFSAICRRNGWCMGDFANEVLKSRIKSFVPDKSPKVTALDMIGPPRLRPNSHEYLAKLKELAVATAEAMRPPAPFQKTTQQKMARLFQMLVDISQGCNVYLSSALIKNVEKISSRWPQAGGRNKFIEFETKETPDFERLPLEMEIEIFEIAGKTPPTVIQRIKGINIGDRLTDNIEGEDFYRFHDVFHYAYAAILHWSPVTRALLKSKRKYDSKKDMNEDGARAILIEEGVSTFVFNVAKRNRDFVDVQAGGLSYDLLKMISALVEGYEVEDCPHWLWEQAILEGFKVFRYLKEHKSGRVVINGRERTINIEPLSCKA